MSETTSSPSRLAVPPAPLAAASSGGMVAGAPDTLAWRLAFAIPAVAAGLLLGAFVGLVVGLWTGLISFVC